jgi:hypothetical protein
MPGETPAAAATPPAGTPPPSPVTGTPPAGQPVQPQGAPPPQAGAPQGSATPAQPPEPQKGQPAAPAAPAALAIKLPEGSKADPKLVEAYTAHAKKLGMTQEAAQGAWDWFSQAQAEGAKAFEGALQKQVATDVQTLMADKEFGGVNYTKTLAARDGALKDFFGDDVAKLFKDLGIDTNPGVAKGLARIRALVSGSSVGDKGGQPAAAMTTREAELRRMFPNSYDAMVGKPQQKKTA